MGKKKKHHYTPNFILRGFTSDKGRLWVLDKTTGHCWSKGGGADHRFDAFAENNYNSLIGSAGSPDTSIEDYLEAVEDGAAPIIRDLVDYASADLYPTLSHESRSKLAEFLWAQHLRSPWTRHRMGESEDGRRYFQAAVDMAKQIFGLDAAQVASLLGRSQALIEGGAKMVVKGSNTHEIVRLMSGMKIDLARIPVRNGHFVTSDRPCLIAPVARSEGKVLMALTKAVMLQLSRTGESRGELVPVNADTVDRLNRQTFGTATRFVAGPSADYLKALWKT